MQDKSERLERFKSNPKNFPFKKKEENSDIAEENTPAEKRRRILPIKFKKRKEINQTYDSVKRKNPVDVNGISKQHNGDAMNVLTAPTQMLINSAITALFSFKKNEKPEKEKNKKDSLENEVPKLDEKSKLNLPFNNTVGFPNKKSWNDVDWEYVNSNYPNFMNSMKSFNDTAKTQTTKLLESGFSVNQISPNSSEPEIKKAFELIQDKSKDLFKSALKDNAKSIKADLSEIKDIKEFVVKLNVETGRKMSPVEMLINIILLKESKGENTDKEIDGLFNYMKKENLEIDFKKCGKDFAKAIEKGIDTGILAVGKSMEVAGKTMEISGKAMEATGQGMVAIGEAAQAIPVVGNIVGGGLIAGGTAVESAGKGVSSAGEGVSKAGEEASKQSKKPSKNPLENSDFKIKGFIKKAVEIEQELDRTSQPQESSIML